MPETDITACIGCKKSWDDVPRALRVRATATAKKGDPLPRCEACQKKSNHTETRRKRKIEEIEDIDANMAPILIDKAGLEHALEDLAEGAWTEFEGTVSGFKNEDESVKECALRVSHLVLRCLGYKFTFCDQTINKKLSTTTVNMDCLQRDTHHQAPKKPCTDPAKQRDKRRKPRFPCNGKLKVTFNDNSHLLHISLLHDVSHVGYRTPRIPAKWKEYIRKHKEWTPSKIWKSILKNSKTKGAIAFKQRSVHYYWMQLVSHEWEHDNDPIESARKYIKANELEENVKLMDIEEEPGTQVIAFIITDFMDNFKGWTQSFLTDSTFGTNKQNLELFAGVADIKGEGLPLTFLFIKKDNTAAEGAKQKVLVKWFQALKDLGVDPEFTLSDKDDSEINAMREVWPLAKHQLCAWHALRAWKRRLAKILEGLAFYDAKEAHRQFSIINESWLPYSRLGAGEIPQKPPKKPIFTVKLTIGGRPPVITPGAANELVDEPQSDEDDRSDAGNHWADQAEEQQVTETGLLGDEEFDEDEAAGEEFHEMMREANEQLKDDNDEEDSDSDIEEESSTSEEDSEDDFIPPTSRRRVQGTSTTKAKPGPKPKLKPKPNPKQTTAEPDSTEYVFCPPAHRLAIMRLFSKHFCQHPMLPERHGQSRTADQIYRDAVIEMYLHCERNHLRDVWAYAWVNWYQPKMWSLWARSAYPLAIPRKRTTMEVESMWRNFKRMSMPHHARVSTDLAAYLLVTETIEVYRQRALKHTRWDPRKGLVETTSSEQDEFKAAWKRLSMIEIKGNYDTNPNSWTCNCGSQKYHSYLLCKHLVQSVPKPCNEWWPKMIRYSVPPFYVIPGVPAPMEPEKITNYEWLSRRHSDHSERDADNGASINQSQEITVAILASPTRAENRNPANRMAEDLMGSTEDGDERTRLEDVKTVLKDLLNIVESQQNRVDPIFLRTLERSLHSGRSLRDAVHELRNARTIRGTWERRSQLTWGYQL